MKFFFSIYFLLTASFLNAQNFSNKGKEFWVGYGHNQLFNADANANSQDMVLYLSAEQAANVTVSVNGTSWVKTYSIPANTVLPTDLMPKEGASDCRILSEGFSNKGIHIESDVPIVAYAHTYGLYSSGGTMLLPVESYAFTYFSVNPEQNSYQSYSWFYVIASEDNTVVSIMPSRPTSEDHLPNVAFTVSLNKGELYNVMGKQNGNSSYDVSGSKLQSLPGADGKCHPVGVFSGSSRTYICPGDPLNTGSDFIMQQVFPVSAWGTKYITALTSQSTSPVALNSNKFRIYVKERNTLVRKNGILMTGLINNFFYDYLSSTADVITSTKPVLVAQFIPSENGCGSKGLGDPEMFCLSPVEQAIKHITFYNTDKENIQVNYLTMIIPDNGMSSLRIDGSNQFDSTYPHPNAPGYSVVIKQLPLAPMQHTATSDSAFTSITYGLGEFESYGYNAGTLLRDLESEVEVQNIYAPGLTPYTCPGTQFHPVLKTLYKPSSILWKLSDVKGLLPNEDVLLTNYPTPTDSVIQFQRKFYLYQLPGNYAFDSIGTYNIPVTITDLLIANCSYSSSVSVPVNVIAGPDIDFNIANKLCEKDSIALNGISTAVIDSGRWGWNFGDGTIDSVQHVNKLFAKAADYKIKLSVIRAVDGCIANIEKPITIQPAPSAEFKLKDSVICMPGGIANFIDESFAIGNSGLNYQWNFGDSAISSSQNPGHHFTTSGAYKVHLLITAQNSGCIDSAIHIVNQFFLKPTAAFDPAVSLVCVNSQVNFNDISAPGNTIKSRQWLAGNELFSTVTNPSKVFTDAGSINIKLIVTDVLGCTDTAQKTWQIFPAPVISAGEDKVVSPGNSVQLDGRVDDPLATYFWSPAASLSSATILKPLASPSASQLYFLTAVSANKCIAKDSVQVQVQTILYVPNAFSPNGDGLNDTWVIPALRLYSNASVIIFNRYGEKIFESNNYNVPWDGRYKGKMQPTGAYFYMIDTHSGYGGKMQGAVMIVR